MELAGIPNDPHAGYLEDDSELEYSDCSDRQSSEDEDFGPLRRGSPGSSEDEFEREMESEVTGALEMMISPTAIQAMQAEGGERRRKRKGGGENVTARAGPSGETATSVQDQGPPSETKDAPMPSGSGSGSGSHAEESRKEVEYYDDIYFNSSSDEGGGEGEGEGGRGKRERRKKGKVRKLTNDELFYDPHMDEEDEKWVARQRMAYHNVKVSRKLEQQKRERTLSKDRGHSGMEPGQKDQGPQPADPQVVLPRSDAILNCPACMTTLCLDCQRHESYVTQYRAMFVMNCRLVRDEVLKYIPKPDKKPRKRRRQREGQHEGDTPSQEELEPETYHPVHCSECNTEVAVYDKEEVFHFFNVLASAP